MKTQNIPGTPSLLAFPPATARSVLLLSLMLVSGAAQPVGSLSETTPVPTVTNGRALAEVHLRTFLSRASQDPSITALLRKHKLMLWYSVPELGRGFHLGVQGETVVSGFGQPARQPEVVFVSDLATLDQFLRNEGSEGDLRAVLHLNVIRKLKLQPDLKPFRSALARIYRSALSRPEFAAVE